MSRKLLSFVLVLSLVFLVACGGNNGNNNAANNEKNAPVTPAPVVEQPTNEYGDTGGLTLPLVDKPTTITWMLVSDNPANDKLIAGLSLTSIQVMVSDNPANDKLIAKEIEKRTGITLDIQAIPSATFQDKLRVKMASGKLPDIFHGLKPAELKKLGQQKAVVAINEYADMLPNFTKLYLEENAWVAKSYGDEQGNLYTWPIYQMNRDVNHGFMYRKDIFEKNGIPEWTNTEEFYQALVKLKEIYPDSYPLASKTVANIFRDFAYGWGIGGTNYPTYYDEATKEWKFASTQPENLEMITFMKKLYDEKLLDPEFITATTDSWTAKMTTDQSFVTYDWIGRLDLFYNQVSSTNPEFDLRYANPVGPTGNIRTLPLIDTNFGITVANNDNKEAALKLLDYLTSPSGAALVTLGVEGETFTFDADGKPVYPELADLPVVDIKALEDKYGLWLEGMYLAPDRRSVYFNYTEKEQEAQDKMLEAKKFEAIDPVLNFTDEETSQIADLQITLQKAAEEFNTKFVLDKNYGAKQWEDWKVSAEKQGAGKMVEIFNAAQKRFDAAN